jgi:hypothetical protein
MGIPATLQPPFLFAEDFSPQVGEVPQFSPHEVFTFYPSSPIANNVIIKHPIEEFPIAMDFANDMGVGEAIILVGTITDSNGTAISDFPRDVQLSGTRVAWWIRGGTASEDIRIQVNVILNNGDQRSRDGIVKVRA